MVYLAWASELQELWRVSRRQLLSDDGTDWLWGGEWEPGWVIARHARGIGSINNLRCLRVLNANLHALACIAELLVVLGRILSFMPTARPARPASSLESPRLDRRASDASMAKGARALLAAFPRWSVSMFHM